MADKPQQFQQVAAAVRVARMPAQYSIDQPLNFAERNDIIIFKNGCASLEGKKYDGTKLKIFLAQLSNRATQFNWSAQGMLTYGPNNPNLLTVIPAVQPNQPAEIINDGPCFLKAIIDDTYANIATNMVLARHNLANFREHIKTIPEYNITLFH